jgi:predicted metal-dependent HD superfamily phosphohydrolase
VATSDGFIDRTELARIVRENPGSVETLNSILRKPLLLRYGDMIAGKEGIVLVDAALLVEFGLTHLGNHHAVVVTAPVETRVERVVSRYAQNGRSMSREDVLTMFSLQMSGEDKIAALESTIEENKNGSVLAYDNGGSPIDAKKALFDILAKIDVFGELRAGMVLRMFGIGEFESSALVAELKKKYEEPHRFYHTWEHVVELLNGLFERACATDMPQEEMAALGVAVLFHDSVYDVSRTYYRDNEIHSAEYAKRALSSRGVEGRRVENAYRLIRETAHTGGEKPTERLSMILHDLDMSVLGSSPERYALYVSDIIAEFGIYPGREFAKARLELLNAWIADEDLFVTEYGKRRFLSQARKNMESEVAGIGSRLISPTASV